MTRRGSRYNRGGAKRQGTPTADPPRPQAIDDYSGFKVPLDKLSKDWQGLLTVSPDRRNPQDFVRGVKDDQSLPYSRPESADQFTATNIVWQSGAFMTTQQGGAIITQGLDPADTL